MRSLLKYKCDKSQQSKKKVKILINKLSWEEFRNNGMLWWINQILHTFGLAIVFDYDEDGDLKEVYPARVRFRGFGEKQIEEGYIKVSQYLKDNCEELLNESKE